MLDIETYDLVSVFFILISIILSYVISFKAIKSYRENKIIQTLIFGIASFFVANAQFFLVLEKTFLSVLDIDNIGIIFGLIATILSAGGVLAIDAFAFKVVFPKKALILTVISGIILLIYEGFWIFDPTRTLNAETTEIIFGDLFGIGYPFTPLLSYFTLMPLLVIPVLVFFYFARKIREESPSRSEKSWVFGLALLCVSIAYITELLGIDPLLTAGFRVLFPISGVLFYWALFKMKEKEF